jgi:PAS domain S-box-containing protein
MINDAHLRIAGITREQDKPATWRRINHPDNPDEQDAFMYDTDEGRIKHFTIDKRYVHPNGRTVWVAFSRQRKILDDGGFEDLCTAVNITHRKEVEENLRESEERYRSTITDLQVGVVVHAEDTRIVLSNPAACRILGLTAEQMAGKTANDPAWKFIREVGSVMPREEYPVNRVMSTGKSISNQIVGIMKPGRSEPTWVTTNAVRVFSDGSYLFRIIVNFMDVTEQINAELSLKTRNAELERFNKVTVGRELRMIELKKEINALCRERGCDPPYSIPQAATKLDGTA